MSFLSKIREIFRRECKILKILNIQGDGNVRYYEIISESPYVCYLSQFISGKYRNFSQFQDLPRGVHRNFFRGDLIFVYFPGGWAENFLETGFSWFSPPLCTTLGWLPTKDDTKDTNNYTEFILTLMVNSRCKLIFPFFIVCS